MIKILRVSNILFLLLSVLSINISAQAEFSDPIPNPDGIDLGFEQGITRPEFHDLENDGDGDIFFTYFQEDLLSYNDIGYLKNIGTASEAAFDSLSVQNITGPDLSFINQFSYGDLNNDGTIDALQLFQIDIQDEFEWEFFAYLNDAQDTFVFSSSFLYNPYSLDLYTSSQLLAFINLEDFDNDNDLDLIISEFSGDLVFPPVFNMLYMENEGTPETPQFSAPQAVSYDPDGVDLTLLPSFGDFDRDGDLDLLGTSVNDGYVDFSYFENTGSEDLPEFSNAQRNPFNLDTIQWIDDIVTPTVYDYDNDGDLDLFVTKGIESPKTLLYLNQSVSKIQFPTLEEAGIRMYPNPVSDRLTILMEHAEYGHLILYDMNGSLVLHRSIKGSAQENIDVSQLPSGAYILHYENRESIASGRIIVE